MEKMSYTPSGFDVQTLSPGLLDMPGGVLGRSLQTHASSSTGWKLKLGDMGIFDRIYNQNLINAINGRILVDHAINFDRIILEDQPF